MGLAALLCMLDNAGLVHLSQVVDVNLVRLDSTSSIWKRVGAPKARDHPGSILQCMKTYSDAY